MPAFTYRFVALAGRQNIRHDEVLTTVEKAFLEQTLFGRRYDPRRRAYVDAFPGRQRLVEQVVRCLVEDRRAETPVQSLPGQEEDYADILASGVLHEIPGQATAAEVVVRFASRAALTAVLADVLRRDRPFLEKLLCDAELAALCNTIAGLEMGLVEALEQDLERPDSLAVRLLCDNPTGIRRRVMAGVLVRLAGAGTAAVGRALQQLHWVFPGLLEDLIGQALDEGTIFARPEAAAALAQAAFERTPVQRSQTLMRMSRALRRSGKAEQAERVLRTVPTDPAPATEAARVYFLGSLLRNLGRWEEGLVALGQAQAAYQALGDRDRILIAGAACAETLSLLGRHEEAARELDAAECAGQGAALEVELRFRVKHAMSLRMRGLLRKAYTRCEDVLRRSTSARLLHLAAHAQTEMGIIHALLEDAPGAIDLLTQAIVTKRQLGDNRGLKQAYLSLGFAYALSGNVSAASAAYSQSLTLNQDTNNVYGELLCLEFLLRLDPRLVHQPTLLRAVTLANRAADWKNPRIQGILDQFNQQLSTQGGNHGPV